MPQRLTLELLSRLLATFSLVTASPANTLRATLQAALHVKVP